MALTFKLDDKQMEELRAQHREQVQASKDLSDNLTKWLGLIVKALGGEADDDTQAKIDQSAASVRASREKLQTAVDNQTKGQ